MTCTRKWGGTKEAKTACMASVPAANNLSPNSSSSNTPAPTTTTSSSSSTGSDQGGGGDDACGLGYSITVLLYV